MDPLLAASIVDLQRVIRSGRMRYVYGQYLLPPAALVLRERVAAIEQQFKDQLLSLDQARLELATLAIDGEDQAALLSRWAATLKKTPGASVLISPWTGLPIPS